MMRVCTRRSATALAVALLVAACAAPPSDERPVAAVEAPAITTAVASEPVLLAPAVRRTEPERYRWILYGDWIDADGDCQDTEQEVLIAESRVAATLDPNGCRVVGGLWLDPYTGQYFTNPGALAVDHIVPFRDAHRSGADLWSAERREAYVNDLILPESLTTVSRSAARSRRGRDPAGWLPPDPAFHCAYVKAWVAVKERWDLETDPAEAQAIAEVLARCS